MDNRSNYPRHNNYPPTIHRATNLCLPTPTTAPAHPTGRLASSDGNKLTETGLFEEHWQSYLRSGPCFFLLDHCHGRCVLLFLVLFPNLISKHACRYFSTTLAEAHFRAVPRVGQRQDDTLSTRNAYISYISSSISPL